MNRREIAESGPVAACCLALAFAAVLLLLAWQAPVAVREAGRRRPPMPIPIARPRECRR